MTTATSSSFYDEVQFVPGFLLLLEACGNAEKAKEIHEISFTFKRLKEVPSELINCVNLQKLSLTGNNISNVDALVELKTLVDVNLSNNNICILPQSIGKLTFLKNLCIDHNSLRKLPNGFGALRNLTSLSLNFNHLQILEQIVQITSLRELYLQRNGIVALPNDVCNLQNLKVLDLSENNLRSLPTSLFQCHSIRELNVSSNYLSDIHLDIEKLTSIKDLFLDGNCLQSLPSSLCKLSATLKKLSVSENNLSVLPENFNKLRFLEELDLSSNKFEALTSDVLELPSLICLNLAQNQLHILEGDFPPGGAPLVELKISYNCLRELPLSIRSCLSLRLLHASHNRIAHLPEGFSNLEHLEELHLSKNSLSYFPPVICALTALQDLDLDYNKVTFIPPNIGDLQNLEALWMKANEINALPVSLANLTSLQHLDLSGNPLREIPSGVVKGGKKAIFQHLLGYYQPPKPNATVLEHFNNSMKTKLVGIVKDKRRSDFEHKSVTAAKEHNTVGTSSNGDRGASDVILAQKFQAIPPEVNFASQLSRIQGRAHALSSVQRMAARPSKKLAIVSNTQTGQQNGTNGPAIKNLDPSSHIPLPMLLSRNI